MHSAVNLSANLAASRIARWRPLVLIGLSTVNVGLAALAGLSPARVIALAVMAGVFAAGVGFAPPARQKHCEGAAHPFHPLLACAFGVAITVGITGGLASPFMVILPGPVLLTWTAYGPGRESRTAALVFGLTLVSLLALPDSWKGPPLLRAGAEALACWSALLTAVMMAVQIKLLMASLTATTASLDCVRRGMLDDAASRRRGLEAVGTKLAHELKNPLAAIKSLLQLESAAGLRDDRSRRRFEVMASEVSRMEAILRDYLTFSRPIDDLAPAEIELTTVVDEVVATLEGRADAAGVRLEKRGRGGAIVADARRLREALLNLTANALEATPRGGSVDVSYEVGTESTKLTIRDTGIGMTPAVKARVGTPFFTTREAGTGLGVVIARSAIVQHGGSLEFVCPPEGGTTATILLPRTCGKGSSRQGVARG
jgi:signal transduction histidine kinase